MKRQILLTLAAIALLACCAKNNSTTVSLSLSGKADASITDLYELESVIPLETNDLSFFGEARTMLFGKDRIVITTGSLFNSKDYFVFDGKGKFLYRQNRAGRGPGEYTGIRNTFVNGDSVIVYSRDSKLLFYDIDDGHLLAEKRGMPTKPIVASAYLPNGKMLINYSFPDSVARVYNSMQLFSSEGKYLSGFLPLPENVVKFPYFADGARFLERDGQIYFYPLTHNTIFKYNPQDNSLEESLTVQIEGETLFDINNVPQNLASNAGWVMEKTMLWLLDAGNDYKLINVSRKGNTHIVDVNSDGSYRIVDISKGDVNNGLPIKLVDNNSGTLVSLLYPNSILEYDTHYFTYNNI